MSRIRVAAFKKKMKLRRIKKYPKSLASITYQKTVTNCTIPEPSKDNLIKVKCRWNKNRTITATKDSAKWDADQWYVDQREAAFKKMKEEASAYKYQVKRKKPWYMLDTRKRRHYEEHKTSYGAHTDYFRVPSEAQEMHDRTIFHPNRGSAWYMEQVVQHKLAKWERKNPCPIKTEQNPPDIFEKEYLIPWQEAKEEALKRIRDFVVSIYDKLPLTGRFEQKDDTYTEEKIADIKDIDGDGHNINKVDPKKSKLIKKAQKITNIVHGKRKNLICTNLRDHCRNRGRILLPKAA